jgi:type VI secretion system secreted protein VgrG
VNVSGGPPPVPSIPYPSWLGSTAAHKVPSGPPSGPGTGGGPPAPGPGATAGLGDKVTIPPELKAGLATAWADSFPGGKSQEQAGVLVQKADGTVEWRRVVDGVSGSLTGGTASFDYPKLAGAGEKVLAAAHTHPYDASEGGHKDVSFSGADLARMAVSTVPETQHYMRSGDTVFMVAETPDFQKLVTITGEGKLRGEMDKTWNDTFTAATGTIQERSEAATKSVCHQYHLDYYKGKDDTLTKVDTAK